MLLLLIPAAQAQNEPIVRIGLNQNAATVTIRSASAFSVQQHRTRSATVTAVLSLRSGAAAATLKKSDLQYRMVVELDGGVVLALSPGTRIRVASSGCASGDREPHLSRRDRSLRQQPEHADDRQRAAGRGVSAGRGAERAQPDHVRPDRSAEGTGRGRPNLRAAATWGSRRTKATTSARPMPVRCTWGREPKIRWPVRRSSTRAAWSRPSTANRSTPCTRPPAEGAPKSSENIFDLKVPYLVSTSCEYKHPEPLAFSTSRSFPDWRKAVLAVAGVSELWRCAAFHGPPGYRASRHPPIPRRSPRSSARRSTRR